MIKNIIIATALLFTIGCSELEGDRGPQGPAGEQGPPGTPVFGATELISLSASRSYTPSEMLGDLKVAPPGIYTLPTSITIGSGNAGNGWLTINLDGVRFCYQGAASNSNTLSNVFNFRGIKTSGGCDTGGTIAFANTLTVFDESEVVITINGGGCGSVCASTTVSTSVRVKRFVQ